MKKYFHACVALVILGGLCGVLAAPQTVSGQRATADIPFTFSVGKHILPAGKYEIRIVNPSSDQNILQIRSINGRLSVLVQTNGVRVDAAEDGKLIFDRYGDRYFFTQVQLAGTTTGLAPVQSSRERAERKALTRENVKKVVAVITSN